MLFMNCAREETVIRQGKGANIQENNYNEKVQWP